MDIFRWIASYYRFASYFYFIVFAAIGEVNLPILIFIGTTIGIVYIYSIIAVLAVGHRRLSLLYGFFLNKILNPFLTLRIFTEILLNFDDFAWGKTQQVKGTIDGDEDEEYEDEENDNTTLHVDPEVGGIDDGKVDSKIDLSQMKKGHEKYDTIEGIREIDDENTFKRRVKQKKDKTRITDIDFMESHKKTTHNTSSNRTVSIKVDGSKGKEEMEYDELPTNLKDTDALGKCVCNINLPNRINMQPSLIDDGSIDSEYENNIDIKYSR